MTTPAASTSSRSIALSTECYWALGRPFEVVERTAREAARVVGLYHCGRQVGYARVVSDGLSVTYLAEPPSALLTSRTSVTAVKAAP